MKNKKQLRRVIVDGRLQALKQILHSERVLTSTFAVELLCLAVTHHHDGVVPLLIKHANHLECAFCSVTYALNKHVESIPIHKQGIWFFRRLVQCDLYLIQPILNGCMFSVLMLLLTDNETVLEACNFMLSFYSDVTQSVMDAFYCAVVQNQLPCVLQILKHFDAVDDTGRIHFEGLNRCVSDRIIHVHLSDFINTKYISRSCRCDNIQYFTNTDWRSQFKISGGTPLIQAVLQNNIQLTKFFIDGGADIDLCFEGKPPVSYALTKWGPDSPMVQLLRLHGAFTAFELLTQLRNQTNGSARNTEERLLNLILNKGLNPQSYESTYHYSFLLLAVLYQELEIARALVQMGATFPLQLADIDSLGLVRTRTRVNIPACVVCGKKRHVRMCKCFTVGYCGVSCQRLHWKVHRASCAYRFTQKYGMVEGLVRCIAQDESPDHNTACVSLQHNLQIVEPPNMV